MPSPKLLSISAAAVLTLILCSCSSGTSSTSQPTAPTNPMPPTNPTPPSPPAATVPDVTTYHYNLNRDGLNAQETILTPANVSSASFGKVGFDTVDGKVDAEPLFLANLSVGGATHNVLYVESEHGTAYAFDADSGAQLWKTSVIPSGEMTSDDHKCSQISTEIGITDTPVIDRGFGTNGGIFFVSMSKDASGAYHQRLHALDITTGAELSGSPTEITASYPGTGDNSSGGMVAFDPGQYAERSAVSLINGTLYLGFTSHCDFRPYTGWLMGYSESTLKQTQLLNLTPNGNEGSIWMSGNGFSADAAGNIYLLDANGTFDTTFDASGMPTSGDYGNAMLKLRVDPNTGKIGVVDYFNAFNTVMQSADDVDLGSGGQVLLPDMTDASGTVRHLIVGAGKDKNIYLADRDNLGKFNAAQMDGNLYQKITGQLAGLNYTTPAFFNGVLYIASDGDTLKAFPFTSAKLATTPSSHSAATFAHPGSTPAVSANGTKDGIVWAVESGATKPGVLHAYDPTNLQNEFYNSNQAASGRDSFGNGNKFITPLVVNGKVYIGTQTGVAVFGLLPH
ncbi:MAG TPA: pyrrolo-quinoline quinone [Granulicella sp.]